jgi:hypothetical protein
MPGKNRPKRLNRNISWRVARRKKKISDRTAGEGRSRKPRPKKKSAGKPVEKKVVAPKKVEKKAVKKVSKKVAKKE